MESAANLHHQHQLQDQLTSASSSSSSSLTIPSCFGLGSSHVWTPNIALNTCNYINPRVFNGVSGQKISTNNVLVSPLNSSMVQDLGFQWSGNGLNSGSNFFSQSLQDESKMKGEMSAESLPKFTEILMNSPSTASTEDFHFPSTNHIKNNNDNDRPQEQEDLNDLSQKLLIKTLISSGCQINGSHQMKVAGEFYNNEFFTSRNRGHFSQIYPSINVSNWNLSSNSNTPSFSNSSLDLNLQTPADMLASTRSDMGNFSHSQDNNFGIFKESLPYSHHDQMQQQQQPTTISCVPRKLTSFSSEVTEAKRPSNSMEPMVINQTHPAPKKTRLESRASCPPFKVRKEKLGDRIAALQQLVAPFGKTDTASVLMEAIGYIKFLQNQVETLSVPYMKQSCNKTNKPMHRNSMDDANGELNRDLRSRGLCLVPLGCLSYVTGDGGGAAIWPPLGFNGGSS